MGRKPGGPIRRRGTLRGALLPTGSHRAGDARQLSCIGKYAETYCATMTLLQRCRGRPTDGFWSMRRCDHTQKQATLCRNPFILSASVVWETTPQQQLRSAFDRFNVWGVYIRGVFFALRWE